MTLGNGKTLKKYREGNVTAAFGTDLFMQGSTAIPNLLLKYYPMLDITDWEMMLIIQLIRLRNEEGELYPGPKKLVETMTGEESIIATGLKNMLDKEILALTEYYDVEHDRIVQGYDFEPLYEKLSEVWACGKVKEIEEIKKLLDDDKSPAKSSLDLTEPKINMVKIFETEFGRPLSPIEVEQICQWWEEFNETLVLEALRRAVLNGKHNLRYINSILLEWHKNNIRTMEAVQEYDRQFQKRKTPKTGKRQEVSSKTEDKKKAMVRSLYFRG